MTTPPATARGPENLPDPAPLWPGLCAAATVAVVLAAADALRLLASPVRAVAGGLMVLAQALVVFAGVTLLVEVVRARRRRRELEACRSAADEARGGWPVAAYRDALTRVYKRYSTSELRAELEKTAGLLLERQGLSWSLGRMVAFVVPAIGFCMTLWNVHVDGRSVPFGAAALPLSASLGESAVLLIFAQGVAMVARLTLTEWRLFAEQMAVERPAEGLSSKAPDDSPEGEELQPEAPRLPEFPGFPDLGPPVRRPAGGVPLPRASGPPSPPPPAVSRPSSPPPPPPPRSSRGGRESIEEDYY